MVAPGKESPPGETTGFKGATGGGVQMNDDVPATAAAAVVSDPSAKLLPKYKLLAKATLDRRLSKADSVVLVAIMERINSVTGKAFPSTSCIAEDTGVNDRTVSRAVNSLCELGYLIRKSGNRTNANEYRLGTGETVGTGEFAGTGESVAMYGRACPKGTGEFVHPIHVTNPLKESAEEKHLPGANAPRYRNYHQDEGHKDKRNEAVTTDAGTGISIPLKGGGEHVVTMAQIREWQQIYTAKDVLAELKQLREWNLSNPGKQKTKSGIRKHITGWLAQPPKAGFPPGKPSPTHAYFHNVKEKFADYDGPTVSLL